jgi:hypothetical protein
MLYIAYGSIGFENAWNISVIVAINEESLSHIINTFVSIKRLWYLDPKIWSPSRDVPFPLTIVQCWHPKPCAIFGMSCGSHPMRIHIEGVMPVQELRYRPTVNIYIASSVPTGFRLRDCIIVDHISIHIIHTILEILKALWFAAGLTLSSSVCYRVHLWISFNSQNIQQVNNLRTQHWAVGLCSGGCACFLWGSTELLYYVPELDANFIKCSHNFPDRGTSD